MQLFAGFSFYLFFYSSWPSEMDLRSIWETTNKLSLALKWKILKVTWKILNFINIENGKCGNFYPPQNENT